MQGELAEKTPKLEHAETSLHVLRQMLESQQQRNQLLQKEKSNEAVEAERLLLDLAARQKALAASEAQVAEASSQVARLQSELRKTLATAGRGQWLSDAEAAAKLPAVAEEAARRQRQLEAAREESRQHKGAAEELKRWHDDLANSWFPQLARTVNSAIERGDMSFRLPLAMDQTYNSPQSN